jgi:hypothetical protein
VYSSAITNGSVFIVATVYADSISGQAKVAVFHLRVLDLAALELLNFLRLLFVAVVQRCLVGAPWVLGAILEFHFPCVASSQAGVQVLPLPPPQTDSGWRVGQSSAVIAPGFWVMMVRAAWIAFITSSVTRRAAFTLSPARGKGAVSSS